MDVTVGGGETSAMMLRGLMNWLGLPGLAVALGMMIGIGSTCAAAEATRQAYLTDIEEAKQVARQSDKPIMIVFR